MARAILPLSQEAPTEDLKDLYDNAPCGYLSLSPDGRIVKVNRTLADWLLRPADELVGHSIHELLTFGAKIAFETHLAPLLRLQGFVHEIALDMLDANQEKIPVIANAAERRSPWEEHLFTRLTVFKAVDRRTFERSLIEARAKAQAEARSEHQATELRDQFIAVLGHDLRNPLGALTAGLRVLRRAETIADREQLVMREMEGCISRANKLIDDVMDFARGRLGSGLAMDLTAAAPVQPVLEQVASEMRSIYPDRLFEVDLEVAQGVDCDPHRIGQLASNLLANAFTHGSADPPVRFTARTTADSFELSVLNEGDPIDEESLSRLFEPFFRADHRKGRSGLGLGLFISHEIAQAHGGTIRVRSDENETCFLFSMPRQNAERNREEGDSAP